MEAPLHPTKVPAGGGAGTGFQLPLPSRLSSMFGPLALFLGCVWRARASPEFVSSHPFRSYLTYLLLSLFFFLIITFGFFWCWICALKRHGLTRPSRSLSIGSKHPPLLRACSSPPPPYTKNIPHDPDSSQKAWQRKVQPPAFPDYQDSGHPGPESLDILQPIWPDLRLSDSTLHKTHRINYVYTASAGHATRDTRGLQLLLVVGFLHLFSSTIRGSSRSQTATVSTCSLTTPTPPALSKLRQSLRLHQTIRVALFPVSEPRL
ncbi:hypothetical protein QR685DRAFT_223810 [Neurospora intermedia]|uniref:Uncharacterized protein n=1 Tax=Neurospora intermedia TaxID=5142 RepID=A0ABR3DJV3_NEUIN